MRPSSFFHPIGNIEVVIDRDGFKARVGNLVVRAEFMPLIRALQAVQEGVQTRGHAARLRNRLCHNAHRATAVTQIFDGLLARRNQMFRRQCAGIDDINSDSARG